MKMNKSKAILLGVVAALGINQVYALDTLRVAEHAFTAQQAVDYAMKNNVQVKNALLGIKLQQETNRQVTSAAFPHINGSISTTANPNVATQVIPNFISPATYQVLIDKGVKDGNGNPINMPPDFGFISAQFGTRYSANAAVSLNQILFDGQVFVGLQARRAAMEFADKNAALTAEIIKANVLKVYYQLVVSRTQLELLDSTIAFVQKNLADTRVLYQNGFREKLDIDRVAVQLANLQTEKNKALAMVSNGYYGLKVLMGMPVSDQLTLTDTLTPEMIKDGMLDSESYDYKDRKEFQYADLGRKTENRIKFTGEFFNVSGAWGDLTVEGRMEYRHFDITESYWRWRFIAEYEKHIWGPAHLWAKWQPRVSFRDRGNVFDARDQLGIKFKIDRMRITPFIERYSIEDYVQRRTVTGIHWEYKL